MTMTTTMTRSKSLQRRFCLLDCEERKGLLRKGWDEDHGAARRLLKVCSAFALPKQEEDCAASVHCFYKIQAARSSTFRTSVGCCWMLSWKSETLSNCLTRPRVASRTLQRRSTRSDIRHRARCFPPRRFSSIFVDFRRLYSISEA